MENLLKNLIEKNRHLTKKGNVADYIPALSIANPDEIGIAVMDTDGNIHTSGDYNTKFTIQSISKVIALMAATMDLGEEKVFDKIGYNGSEEAFNNIIKLDSPFAKYPTNPMINAGAIVTTSLIVGSGDEKFEKILELLRLITKNPNIDYNKAVYLSESETGDRNRAIAYLMKSKGMINGNVEEILDSYFKQCSIEIDTVDLAKIGVFIAKGCKPLNNTEYISSEKMTTLLRGIMTNAGMYDYSGEYAIKVGIPSKSGVGGGIMGTVTSKMGIGIYSPALDVNGNSIAGIAIMKDLSNELRLNLFN